MTRITIVIEDHAEGIHLGQQLAGGRVVAAIHGGSNDLMEALERIADMPWGTPQRDFREIARAAITKARI